MRGLRVWGLGLVVQAGLGEPSSEHLNSGLLILDPDVCVCVFFMWCRFLQVLPAQISMEPGLPSVLSLRHGPLVECSGCHPIDHD